MKHPNKTIEQLEKKGYSVTTAHHRRFQDKDGNVMEDFYSKKDKFKPKGTIILAHGGRTISQIQTPEGDVVNGEAQCVPEDVYCYRRGRAISVGRALKKLETV